jgi:flagellar basal-body rod modification protein FlgD
MDISALTSSPTVSGSANSNAKLTENFDTFLTLLTTQLKFQDPLEPMDSNEFVAQLVAFTEVEQSIGVNQKLEDLLKFQTGNQTLAALNYIGKTVEAESSEVALTSGEAKFTYALPKAATVSNVLITDANGVAVATLPAEKTAGKHTFAWDGRNGQGEPMPDGVYKVVVSARDADDKIIDVGTAAVSRVTGIETKEDGLYLKLGPLTVPFSKVIAVEETPSGQSSG